MVMTLKNGRAEILCGVRMLCARERVMMDWSQTEYLMLVRGIMLGVGSQVVGFLE